jgi:hypothetical protein
VGRKATGTSLTCSFSSWNDQKGSDLSASGGWCRKGEEIGMNVVSFENLKSHPTDLSQGLCYLNQNCNAKVDNTYLEIVVIIYLITANGGECLHFFTIHPHMLSRAIVVRGGPSQQERTFRNRTWCQPLISPLSRNSKGLNALLQKLPFGKFGDPLLTAFDVDIAS